MVLCTSGQTIQDGREEPRHNLPSFFRCSQDKCETVIQLTKEKRYAGRLGMTFKCLQRVKKIQKYSVLKFSILHPLFYICPRWIGFSGLRKCTAEIQREAHLSALNSERKSSGGVEGGGTAEGCVVGLWLDPGPVLLRGLQRKHQSSLLPLQILWTIWDNFSTVSSLLKIKCARISVSEHSLQLGCLSWKF